MANQQVADTVALGYTDTDGTTIKITAAVPLPISVSAPSTTAAPTFPPNIQAVASGSEGVITLFDMTTMQTGSTQAGKLFPTTITINGGTLPALGSGSVVTLKNSSNVCGAIFSPKVNWDSVLIDLICADGSAASKPITIEIGRLAASGAVPQILASVVLTTGSVNLGATAINPLTGLAHTSATWTFFDTGTITSNSNLADVLQSLGLTSGAGGYQLALNVHSEGWYYIQLTAKDAALTELLATITPII